MPDWRAIVRARLTGAAISPTTEMDVAEELAQHLEDRYRQLVADGLSEDEATRASRGEIDSADLLADLADALKHEQ